MASIFTVASKEFSDIVRGKRFIVLVVVFGLVITVAMASVYLNVMQRTTVPGLPAMPRGFLGIAASSTLVTIMSYFAPIMGLALGCDAISGEREKGTLKITLAQPVFRDTVVNGKFIAALFAISLAILIASLTDVGGSVLALGITPTGDDIARLSLFMLFSILFAMAFYGLAAFLSTVARRTTQSVIIGVVLWAVFAFVIPIVANLVASSLVPVSFQFPQNATRFQPGQNMTRPGRELEQFIEQSRTRSAITEAIQSVTPNYHFTRVAQYVLQVYTGIGAGIGAGNLGQSSLRAASLMESLVSAWPNILVLALVPVLTFIASYMFFTRQEVR